MVGVTVLLLLTAFAGRRAALATSSARVRGRFATRSEAATFAPPPFVTRIADRALASRRTRQLERALPFALDDVARSLRSGGSLRMAIMEAASRAAGVLGADLGAVASELADGCPLHDALARWEARRPVRSVRLAVAALSLAAETGGASARAIDGVAATLRVNLGIAGEVKALASQARMSALVIVLAPVAFTALAASTDHRTARFLVATPFGLACLAGGLLLDAIGWAWMRRITAVVA
jgi:tight adherence protein B